MKRLLSVLLSITATLSWGAPWSLLSPGVREETTEVSGLARNYTLRLPEAVTSKKKLPLVVLLHGFTGSAKAIDAYSGFGALAEKEGFILASPDGLGRPTGWNCGFINLGRQGVDDVEFLSKFLDELVEKYPVDPDRVFVAGHSNGAMMANVLGAMRPDRIAAVACVSGLIGVGRSQVKMMPTPKDRVSVLHIHGTGDKVVGYDDQSNAFLVGPSAPSAILWWAEKMGLNEKPQRSFKGPVSILTVEDRKTTVQLWTIPGGPHDWPRKPAAPIDGATVIWDFFKAHPKR